MVCFFKCVLFLNDVNGDDLAIEFDNVSNLEGLLANAADQIDAIDVVVERGPVGEEFEALLLQLGPILPLAE